MAVYADEEEVWRCPTHPSKRRKTGICPICLRDRLNTLCPDCANVRPCSCCPPETSSSSSSSSTATSASTSSSFFLFSSASRSVRVGSVGRVSNLIDSEPAFRRSRSLAIPFLRSRLDSDHKPPLPGNKIRSSFLSIFRTHKKQYEGGGDETTDEDCVESVMMRSRSVSVPVVRDAVTGEARPSSATTKSKGGWHFPSPIKAFRHSKASKVVQERSPLYRG